MPRVSATRRMAGSETHPSCFWTSHKSGITADCWRPAGNLATHHFTSFRLAALKVKLSGWTAARRRTLKVVASLHEIDADDLGVRDGVDGGDLEGLAAGLALDVLMIDDPLAQHI